ncbi:hypothetical protein AKO1_009514 [Acrasis kona]|uniref:FAD-binding domain-containing protein n=1 Tax=Acrasis kona TaxID=1008807 RepID=A0AAW2ZPA5_9EUKA
MSKFNVLISGSGIGASVFAHWLLRANINAHITIVERAPELRLTGASVDIRSSAVDIIKWMGAEEEIRRNNTLEEGVEFVDENNNAIGTLAATGRTDIQSSTSEFEIFRGALAKIFIDPIVDRVKMIFDETVEKYEQQDDQVIVTFSKSKNVEKYDLLVAADGLGSKIRGMMLDQNSRDFVYQESLYVAYFTIKNDLLQGSRFAKWYNATNRRCIFLRPDPAGYTRANLVKLTKDDPESKEKLEKALSEGGESYKDLMDEFFSDAGWLAPEVLKGMRETDDFYSSIFAQVRTPKIVDRRVVLLGDAGYATPGFGTSLAIMGGYVLAGELLNNSNNVEGALKNYQDLVHPFSKESQTDYFVQISALLNPQTSTGIWIRNKILGWMTWTKLDQLMLWTSAKLGFTEKKLNMPDYPWPSSA